MRKIRTLHITKRLGLLFLLICGLVAAHSNAPSASAAGDCLICGQIYDGCKQESSGALSSCVSIMSTQTSGCLTSASQTRTSCRNTATVFTEPRRTEEIQECDRQYNETTAACSRELDQRADQCTADHVTRSVYCVTVREGCRRQCGIGMMEDGFDMMEFMY